MPWLPPILIIAGILAAIIYLRRPAKKPTLRIHSATIIEARDREELVQKVAEHIGGALYGLPDMETKPMPKGWIDEARERVQREQTAREVMEVFEQTKDHALSQYEGHGKNGC